MKLLVNMSAGLLLTAFAVASSPQGIAGRIPPGRSTSKAASTQAHPGWRLGAPIRFENITVFPVIGDVTMGKSGFITLDEGLRSGKVTITEVGSNGRARRLGPGQEASDDADVNKLLLTNRSGKTLVLIAGEIVVGGKQDRIVGHDCLVASGSRPVPLEVFCVEPGRWHEEAAFGQSREVEGMQANRTRRRSGGGRAQVGGGSGGGTGDVARAESGLSLGLTSFRPVTRAIAPPGIREKAQASKDQGAVWNEVAKTEQANHTSSATGNLNAVFENKEVSTRLEDYQRAFSGKLSDNRIVGVIVAIGGKLRSADVFANHSLFDAYWPKLLKSYSLEAVSAAPTGQAVDSSAAESFLSRSKGKRSSGDRSGVYKLVEHQSDKEASFELVSNPKVSGSLIHFNRVTKQ